LLIKFCELIFASDSFKFNSSVAFLDSSEYSFAESISCAIISFLSSITSETLGRAYRDKTIYKNERLIKSQNICGKKVEKSS